MLRVSLRYRLVISLAIRKMPTVSIRIELVDALAGFIAVTERWIFAAKNPVVRNSISPLVSKPGVTDNHMTIGIVVYCRGFGPHWPDE